MATAHHLAELWTGLLLAGGASTRMGKSKANLLVSDRSGLTFFEHSHALLQGCCDQNMVLGHGQDASTSNQLVDALPFAGPFRALVDAFPKVDSEWVLLIPVDMPDLSLELLDEFQAFAESNGGGCFTSPQGQPNGFPVAIPRRCFAAIQELQEMGEASLFRGLKALGFTSWIPSSSQLESLHNINSLEQFDAWRSATSTPWIKVL